MACSLALSFTHVHLKSEITRSAGDENKLG